MKLKMRWIKASYLMPETGKGKIPKHVFVQSSAGKIGRGRYTVRRGWIDVEWLGEGPPRKRWNKAITHWMPIPDIDEQLIFPV